MKVIVDKELCVLTGNCVASAEGVFAIEGDELRYEANPDEADFEGVREAELMCPVQAITVEE